MGSSLRSRGPRSPRCAQAQAPRPRGSLSPPNPPLAIVGAQRKSGNRLCVICGIQIKMTPGPALNLHETCILLHTDAYVGVAMGKRNNGF